MSWKPTPHPAEFEEKEYEVPLYMELARSPGNIWTPGQVLEEHTGWEAALRASLAYWKHVGRRAKTGTILQGSLLGLPPGHPPLSVHGAKPSFRANLFLQAKRCTRYSIGPTALRKLKKGIPRPDPAKGIRAFSIYTRQFPGQPATRHQQEALERFHYRLQRGTAKGDVCYAAPAFDNRQSLWTAAVHGQMVSKSTFPRAVLMKNHDTWVYTDPGARGWKCSDPEYAEGPDLAALTASLLELEPEEAADAPELTASLWALAEAVRETLLVDPQEVPPEPSQFTALKRSFDELEREPAMVVAWTMAAVAARGLLWLVVGPERREGA